MTTLGPNTAFPERDPELVLLPTAVQSNRLPAFKAVVQGAPRFYVTRVMPTAPASPPLGSHHCTVPDRPWAGSHTGAGAALAASSEPGWDAVRGVWEVAFLFSCQCSLEKPALQSLPLMCSRQEAAFVIRCQSECFLALSIDFRDGGKVFEGAAPGFIHLWSTWVPWGGRGHWGLLSALGCRDEGRGLGTGMTQWRAFLSELR